MGSPFNNYAFLQPPRMEGVCSEGVMGSPFNNYAFLQPPRMEGFGSQDVMRSPFNYGSVEDGMLADNLEKKLRNQYWKAKQSVIEKLGKSQDEFVVAGDADIDTKLEVGVQTTPVVVVF